MYGRCGVLRMSDSPGSLGMRPAFFHITILPVAKVGKPGKEASCQAQ